MDPRFIRIKKDPRFKTMKSKKVHLDQRFQLKDNRFKKSKFDQFGNKKQVKDEQLDEVYSYEDENESNSSPIKQSDNYSSDSSDLEAVSNQSNIEDEAPIIDQPTHRLALQNYDWSQIKAKDLMVLFSSFLPSAGVIRQVSVYQSEFGKQKMQEEELNGPREIFKDVSETKKKSTKELVKAVNELIVNGNEENVDVDPQKLRKYELDRLKYYYAIIECDSPETADHIYKNMNDQEFELSNIKIQLRFVPDELELPNDNLHEKCDQLKQINPIKNSINRAVGHTNVKLTWEEQKNRTSFWHGKKVEELDKIDWSEYLGDMGDEDQGNDEEQWKEIRIKESEFQKKDKVINWKDSFNKNKKKKKDFEMEITFKNGFNNDGNAILEKNFTKKKNPIVGKMKKQTDEFFIRFEDEEVNDKKPFKERMKEKRQLQREKQKKSKQQLELLIDNDEKVEFKFNPNDKRFQAAYNNPNYAIDPTAPNFNPDGQLFQEQVKKKKIKL